MSTEITDGWAAPPLAEQAYQFIQGELIARRLRPGDLLDRQALAGRLGFSVAPVDRALLRLQREGFVEILPRRLTRVRTVREGDFRASVLLRNALECQAARVYCGAPVRRARQRLRKLARAVDRGGAESRTVYWQREIAFHRALVELTDSPAFLAAYEQLMGLGLFVLVSTFSPENPFPADPGGHWHADLIDGLQTDDPDEAERLLREHLEYGRDKILRPATGAARPPRRTARVARR
ncbi:MAG: GntR family transcriptional regulator [Candidatus Marinimicrobia bacterium]|nr:GntR family transcriptional regulator [Candidatus Neomarinimicrobiota bacterium]